MYVGDTASLGLVIAGGISVGGEDIQLAHAASGACSQNRSFLGANLLTFFLYAAIGGALFYLPLNLIQVQGYTPTHAGAALFRWSVLMFLLSRWSGGLLDRYGARVPLIVWATDCSCRIRDDGAARYRRFVLDDLLSGDMCLLGLGMSISVAPLTTVVMSSVEEARTGAASGVNNAVSQVAACWRWRCLRRSSFMSLRLHLAKGFARDKVSSQVAQEVEEQRAKAGSDRDRRRAGTSGAIDEAFVAGFRVVTLIAAGLALASAASAAVTMKARSDDSRRR